MPFAPGVFPQIYRAAIQHPDEVDRWLDKYTSLSCKGMVWHGFPTEDEGWFDPLAKKTRDRGMLVGASEGLDTTRRTGAQKGESLGRLAKEHNADIVGLDAEGHWEHTGAEQECTDMGVAFRGHAPNAMAFDQPWSEPNVHGRFPFVGMGRIVQARADQRYLKPYRPYLGKRRYQVQWPIFEGQWQKLEHDELGPAGVLRQRVVTIEQYDYVDIIADGCEIIVRHPTVIAWGEPWADDSFILMLEVRQFLVVRGFIAPDWSNAADAILRFQQEYNKTASVKIGEDNRVGFKETVPAMGLKLGGSRP